jgi:membrane-associated protease RseP (regulator of RpoE activity)
MSSREPSLPEAWDPWGRPLPATPTTPESRRGTWEPLLAAEDAAGETRFGGPEEAPAAPLRPRRRWLPPVLYLLTCLSTYLVGGPLFAVGVMTILTAHELGHYLQARRYRVPASLPYFIPMPLSPVGTMGAIIVMRSRVAHARALFDIAITGPLAGLVPALAFTLIGLPRSTVQSLPEAGTYLVFGEPLLFRLLAHLTFGPLPEGHDIFLHPLAYAGWVGIFITALNLIPIGQLDGGHILYALLRRRAHRVALVLLLAAAVGILAFGYWGWSLLFVLLLVFGPFHPPTADDTVELGAGRVLLGWLTLLFLVVGFTPEPFSF